MKLRFWDKIILLVGAIAVLLVGLAVFIGGLRGDDDVSAAHRMLGIVFGAASAAFGGYLIVLPRRNAMRRRDYVVQRTDTGELRIAVKAIENLVEKCVDLHEEIQLISMMITNTREGVVVELFISLANNISIPLAVASLQKQIKQYLVASSGIEVKEVRVSVESTQDSSPAGTPEPETEQPGEKAAAKEKKAPLHQRLFGREDEPAILPEPPKEEGGMMDEETATEAETEEAAEMVEERYEQSHNAPAQETEAPAEEDVQTPSQEEQLETETEPSPEPDGPETEAELPAFPEDDVPLEEAEDEVPVLREIPEEGFTFAPAEPETGLEPLSESDDTPETAETEEESDE